MKDYEYTDKEWERIEEGLRREIFRAYPHVSKVHINIRPSKKKKNEIIADVVEKRLTLWEKIKDWFKG